jgi:threonine/homoserine/homoserine lactone efflux protein
MPQITLALLMYFVLPLWVLAGLADYLCHRATDIEHTSGWRESLLHLVLLAEAGVPLLAALFLEINALVILLMIGGLVLHELTVWLELRYVVPDGSPRQLVLRGFMVNATNPKGIVFMLAVLPQFIDPSRPQFVQYAICGATLFSTDLLVMSGYTGLAAKVLRALRDPAHIRWMNRTFGSLFIAAGALLATFRRAT